MIMITFILNFVNEKGHLSAHMPVFIVNSVKTLL